jgi:hypothetical protein
MFTRSAAFVIAVLVIAVKLHTIINPETSADLYKSDHFLYICSSNQHRHYIDSSPRNQQKPAETQPQ